MRELFAEAGLLIPRHEKVPIDADPIAPPFPCVLKPLGLSGSRGVIAPITTANSSPPSKRIRRIIDPDESHIQVEQYIPGREFALEGLMTHGALHTLAIFDKPDPLEGPFFEETLYITPSREITAVQQAIVDTTRRAVKALGLFTGRSMRRCASTTPALHARNRRASHRRTLLPRPALRRHHPRGTHRDARPGNHAGAPRTRLAGLGRYDDSGTSTPAFSNTPQAWRMPRPSRESTMLLSRQNAEKHWCPCLKGRATRFHLCHRT